MTLCGMCGNEYEGGSCCPYCGSVQHSIPTGRSRRRRRVITVDLEKGKPVVEDAVARLDREIATAKMKGIQLIRLIHGWGSSGTGGAIKTAVRLHLETLHRSGMVRSFTPGDQYADTTNAGRELLRKYPSLRSSLKTDRENPGITFVEVR